MFFLPIRSSGGSPNPESQDFTPRKKTLLEQSHMTNPPPAMRFAYPLPCGAILHDNGVQFVVISRLAKSMKL